MNLKRAITTATCATACALALGACSTDSGDTVEKEATERSQKNFNLTQPMHNYNVTQARENLLAAHDAMAYGANTWTVQQTEGIGITFECPSRGFPIPFGTQLTNPEKVNWDANGGNFTTPQQEPYGLYPPADVQATYANCVLPSGEIGIFYSEPPLTTYTFDVDCDERTHRCKISSTAKATVKVTKVTPDQVKRSAKPTGGNEN